MFRVVFDPYGEGASPHLTVLRDVDLHALARGCQTFTVQAIAILQ
jgi:hypothetical protein